MNKLRAQSDPCPQGATLKSHQQAWDFVAKQYAGGTSLPSWGTNGEMKDVAIIPEIKGGKFLEIGFGSGDSIAYLLKHGAAHVTGIDFSSAQKKIAEMRIAAASKNSSGYPKRFTLIQQAMDEALPYGLFDCVIAVYSIGWSEYPEKLFGEIHKKLRPGGYFIFSWDHYLSRIIETEEGKLVVRKSYHEPMPLFRENWKGSGQLIETHQLRPSDWFRMLTEAGFSVDGFWEPKPDKDTEPLDVYSPIYSATASSMVPTCVVFRAKKI
ncbi:MAG: ubiquinone/menaquinone biosynthesis methyltransferase ubie [Candidatus Taylorbacteria bacterium]|nr:ubiquinone/menaquinone biosynthesis methyltransferase ubie [Candidatus Taylorbacteria bacterium]